MTRTISAIGVAFLAVTFLAVATVAGGTASAADYDNPAMGDMPCVVIAHYAADRPAAGAMAGGSVSRSAEMAVENVCARSVEVNLCIGFGEPTEGETAGCVVETLRPWATSDIHRVTADVPLTGPSFEWRWVRGTTGSGM